MYHATTKEERRLYRCQLLYATEIARHASALMSTLHHDTRAHELDHTIKTFIDWYGRNDLAHFLTLLADRLAIRGYADCAKAVLGRLHHESTQSVENDKSPRLSGKHARLRLSASGAR